MSLHITKISMIPIEPETALRGSVYFFIWSDTDGWYCSRGGQYREATWESETLGPFPTEADAITGQHDDYEAYQEDEAQLEQALGLDEIDPPQ